MIWVHWCLLAIQIPLGLFTAGHALLYKRDPRAALGWIGVSLTFPIMGPLFYFLFGINRVRTKAIKLERRSPFRIETGREASQRNMLLTSEDLPGEFSHMVRISDAVTRRPLVGGNRIEMLHNGEEAYPPMIEAIEKSERFLYLATYIFETNATGRRFIEALARAAERGVDVRVIIDGVGELYSLPRAGTLLMDKGVRMARFLRPKLLPPSLHINLRNHRKILVADGRVAFMGGMNIGDRHLAENRANPSRVMDTHFRVTGPVINQIEQVFLEDWRFCTGEHVLQQTEPPEPADGAICRTIVEGPNEDLDKLSTILVAAISSARSRVFIMTPYFLPSREMMGALASAALRGLEVDVVLPAKNNLPFVHWATRNMLWELLERGVRVFYQPPPFVHTKLFVVDDYYAHIGSANVDPRSLRLNFELAMEVYDRPFVEVLGSHVEKARERSRQISLDEVDSRSLPARTRDALAWLFTPYL